MQQKERYGIIQVKPCLSFLRANLG
jgi:hypothetical protein